MKIYIRDSLKEDMSIIFSLIEFICFMIHVSGCVCVCKCGDILMFPLN